MSKDSQLAATDGKPEVSVIVPVYNAGGYLEECVESVLGQELTDWELLLVDDGSTDGSGSLADEYALSDSRVRVFHKQNEGVSIARNLGLDNARGKWITFLDADDCLLPGALKALRDKALETGADVTAGRMWVLRDGASYYDNCDMPLGGKPSVCASLRRWGLWGYLFRSEVIQAHRHRFVERLAFCEDMVFVAECALDCRTLSTVDKPVYAYTINSSSATHATHIQVHTSHQLKALERMYALAESARHSSPSASKAILRDCKRLEMFIAIYAVKPDTTQEEYRQLKALCRESWSGDRRRLLRLEANLLKYRLRLWIVGRPSLERLVRLLVGKRQPKPLAKKG
ncbi:MAG: glycosyltransferase [Prevotellaceae bacterium]|nr:glycosyltransferase [Prevotellaceae bacterium]